MIFALRVKIRDADSRTVKNKAVCVALGVTRDGEPGGLGPLDRPERGRPLPARGDERAEEPGHAGYPDRRRGRAQGLPDAITAAVPAAMVQTCIVHASADSALPQAMSREAGAPQPDLLLLEGPQGRGRRSAPDLQRPGRRSGRSRARGLRGEMGRKIRLDRPSLAAGLGPG